MDSSTISAGADFLAQSGVKGMRWGVRKRSANGKAATTGPAHEDHVLSREIRGKKLSEMSNDEIRRVNDRLNLERSYHAMNPSKRQRREAKARGVIATVGIAKASYEIVTSPFGKAAISAGLRVVGAKGAAKAVKKVPVNGKGGGFS